MHVVVNAAMSADGKLSSRRREQIRISGDADFARVDRLRADSDAVVVGLGTVLADDPRLTVKDPTLCEHRVEAGYSRQPARVVIDSVGRTPDDARILDDTAQTYVCLTENAPRERLERLEKRATVITAGEDRVALEEAFESLESAGLERLMVEGGGELIFSLLEAGLVDELSVFVGPLVIGGRDAPTLADGDGFVDEFPELTLEDVERVDEGVLLRWTITGSRR